jgi:hypothetical protein
LYLGPTNMVGLRPHFPGDGNPGAARPVSTWPEGRSHAARVEASANAGQPSTFEWIHGAAIKGRVGSGWAWTAIRVTLHGTLGTGRAC